MFSIIPLLDKYPIYIDAKIIERIVEPERQIIFRVPWIDDKGEIQVNRGLESSLTVHLGLTKVVLDSINQCMQLQSNS